VSVTGFGLHTLSYYSVDNAGNVEDVQIRGFEIIRLANLSFNMVNTLYEGADWKAFDYAYDVELYDAAGSLEDAWSAQTWDSGLPTDTVKAVPAYDSEQPWTIKLILHTLNNGDQEYTWEDVRVEAGGTVDLQGTYADTF